MSDADYTIGEGIDRWRALIAGRDRRERWSLRLSAGTLYGLWGAFFLGLISTVTASTGVGVVLGATGLTFALMPLTVVTVGVLLARKWLARRSGAAILGPRRTPARDAFEPYLPTIAALVGDVDRLAYGEDERRKVESQFDRLAGLLAALQQLGPDRDHALTLAGRIPAPIRDIAEVRRRALARTVSGALPPGVATGLLSGDSDRVPHLVAPSVQRLQALLELAGQSDTATVIAAARRAQDSADRALAALRADIGLTLRTRDLIDGLARELEAVLSAEAVGIKDPKSLLELEERLFRARKPADLPPA